MDGAEEGARLEAKTDAAQVRKRLELVRVPAGGRALDAGAGTGAIARVIADMVGANGSVLALDASQERLALGARIAKELGVRNLQFARGDLYSLPCAPASFDFVWSEFVFEYLADPDAALRGLAALVRPGGKLVVADLDGNAIFHDPVPATFAATLQQLLDGLGNSFDAHAGRRLYGRFFRAGLLPAQVHVLPYHLYPGVIGAKERANWERKLEGLRPRGEAALGKNGYQSFVARYLSLLDDPGTLSYSILFMVEWTRPLS
jgi:SAM-dependent methyltransferase